MACSSARAGFWSPSPRQVETDFATSGSTSTPLPILLYSESGPCICGPMLLILSQKEQCTWKSNTKELQWRRAGGWEKDEPTWRRSCARDRDLQCADRRRRASRTDTRVDQSGLDIAASAFHSGRVAA